jgi:hypothetical protein
LEAGQVQINRCFALIYSDLEIKEDILEHRKLYICTWPAFRWPGINFVVIVEILAIMKFD